MNVHDPVSAAIQGATSPPDALCFAGATDCGVVGLTLARDAEASDPASGAEQVLRLAQAEPLIAAVEQWLQSAWDPAPVAAAGVGAVYQAVVRDPALAPPGTRLHVPLGALLVPPPAALRAPALAWSMHAAQLVLGSVPLDALPPLQAGSLLWLPASFGAAWAVQLVDPARRLPPCLALLDLQAQRVSVAAAGAGALSDEDAADEPRVLLQRRIELPLDHWLGWGLAEAPFHWPVPQPWSAELRVGDAVHARGALLPVGAGCGLLVESLAAVASCDA